MKKENQETYKLSHSKALNFELWRSMSAGNPRETSLYSICSKAFHTELVIFKFVFLCCETFNLKSKGVEAITRKTQGKSQSIVKCWAIFWSFIRRKTVLCCCFPAAIYARFRCAIHISATEKKLKCCEEAKLLKMQDVSATGEVFTILAFLNGNTKVDNH
jgi:hypothetical protein